MRGYRPTIYILLVLFNWTHSMKEDERMVPFTPEPSKVMMANFLPVAVRPALFSPSPLESFVHLFRRHSNNSINLWPNPISNRPSRRLLHGLSFPSHTPLLAPLGSERRI